jgi:nucleotide-binding universal stress UspA family protein
MTPLLIAAVVVLSAALVALAAEYLRYRRRRPRSIAPTTRRILFPFAGSALSLRALEAALRLASAEHATLVPVFLARVSLKLPLETPLPRQCNMAIPLLEAIEQRATAYGVPVDSRIERGRDYRHALQQTIEHESYDRLVVAASPNGAQGFHTAEIAWLLEHEPREIVILRPSIEEPFKLLSPSASVASNGKPASAPARREAGLAA